MAHRPDYSADFVEGGKDCAVEVLDLCGFT